MTFTIFGATSFAGSGDDTVKLWDMATGKERATLRGHRSGICAVAFSPDKRLWLVQASTMRCDYGL